MKVIDLLNKIANGEEVPEVIKVKGGIYYHCEGDQSGCCYFSEKQGFGGFKLGFDTSAMNDKVETIEEIEEDKNIKKISIRAELVGSIDNKLENLDINIMAVEDKINEIIDEINKMKEGK